MFFLFYSKKKYTYMFKKKRFLEEKHKNMQYQTIPCVHSWIEAGIKYQLRITWFFITFLWTKLISIHVKWHKINSITKKYHCDSILPVLEGLLLSFGLNHLNLKGCWLWYYYSKACMHSASYNPCRIFMLLGSIHRMGSIQIVKNHSSQLVAAHQDLD